MRREREKHITRLHIILFFLVIIVGVSLFLITKNILTSNKKYLEFEQVIKDSGKIYYKINNLKVKEDEEEAVDINTLDKEGLLSDNSLIKKCKGYLMISNEYDYEKDKYRIYYRPYISCGNKYTTVNYQEIVLIELNEK
ncbi:MAG: hypothetical protein IIZ40_04530 [Bacilli bacterium]|nr:hypothetical protein [Bacilli bacterium]